jgi:plasmid rolling circle replication initiator protein Rep
VDKSNKGILNPFANNQQPFLTDLTKEQDVKVRLVKGKMKVTRKPTWDEQKNYAVQVADIFDCGTPEDQKRAERIRQCANMLEMGWVDDTEGNPVLKLKTAFFCRVPRCPVCQWRRVKKWSARFFEALPYIFEENKNMRFIFLTLTVQNCPVSELRDTVKLMSKAWDKMSRRKKFPALGFVRSLEVTKEKNLYDKSGKKLIRAARPEYCHPHYHVLMAVESSYFNGRNYLSKDDYAEMWQQALKVDYKPVCDVRIVKPKPVIDENGNSVLQGEDSQNDDSELNAMKAALVEVVKYTVKPSDMIESTNWLLELVHQLHKIHCVALGGIFKDYLSVSDDGSLVVKDSGNYGGLLFNYHNDFKRYRYAGSKNQFKPDSEKNPADVHIPDYEVPY